MQCFADETDACMRPGSLRNPLSQCYLLMSYKEISLAVSGEVNEIIRTAQRMILNDKRAEFFYPDPTSVSKKLKPYPSFLHFNAEHKKEQSNIEWVNIKNFSVNEMFSQVGDYINSWHLSESTKFTLVANDKVNIIPRKGAKYFLDACFSKPKPRCPNPLAVARVHFTVIVSELLPKYYPVKVIYRFEGYRTRYHGNGRLEIRSKDFQRYFIDSILQTKLLFYAKVFECRHPQYELGAKARLHEDDGDDENMEEDCKMSLSEDKKLCNDKNGGGAVVGATADDI